jgi:hypothetical protein
MTENRSVGGSIPPLGTISSNSRPQLQAAISHAGTRPVIARLAARDGVSR